MRTFIKESRLHNSDTPVGTAQILLCTAPIFATLLGCIFLKEKFGLFEVFSIVTTTVGVALVVKPMENQTTGRATTLHAVLAALAGAFGWAGSGVLSRHLFKKIHFLVLTTWIGAFAFASIMVAGIASLGEQFTLPSDWKSATLMAALGIIGILAMYTFNASFMVRLL